MIKICDLIFKRYKKQNIFFYLIPVSCPRDKSKYSVYLSCV